MELDGDQEIQPANSESAAASLKRLRWPVLITGVAGAAILVAFQLGLIPGVQDLNGSLGAIGVFCGAAFVGAGGVVGWWVWTRLANSRTRRVTLTAQGILVVFNDEASALLSWADTNLHMTIKEFSNPAIVPDSTILWGKGGMRQYAFVTREGAERVRTISTDHGFRLTNTQSGKPPSVWNLTEISRV
ncbi:MAG: hypothetical protein WB789_06390 [Thermoplasmata archaeon]